MKHTQGQNIWIVTTVGNTDKTVEIEDSMKDFLTQAEAEEYARSETHEYGLRSYVYRCIPIVRYDRDSVKETRL